MPDAPPAGLPGFPAALLNDLRRQRLQLRKHLMLLLCCDTDDADTGTDLGAELLTYLATGHGQVFSGALRRRRVPDPVLQALLQHLFRSIDTTTDTLLALIASPVRTPATTAERGLGAPGKLCRILQLRFVLEEQVVEVLAESCGAGLAHTPHTAVQPPRRQRWKRSSQG